MELFSGKDIKAELQENERSDILFVTFNSWDRDMHPVKPKEMPPFGKGILHSLGFNQVDIKTNKNNWFQTDEMFYVIELVNAFAAKRKCKKVFTYGSSMGGYASINFSSHLRATSFIAISPQYSIDPIKMYEGDSRWRFEFKNIDYKYDLIDAGLNANIDGIVFYDSLTLDMHHAQRINEKTSAVLIDVPHSGHPSGVIINRIYGLKKILSEVADSSFDAISFAREIDAKIKTTTEYLSCHISNKNIRESLKQKVTTERLHIQEMLVALKASVSNHDHEMCELILRASYCQRYQDKNKYADFVRYKVSALLLLGHHEEAFFEAIRAPRGQADLLKKVLCSCPGAIKFLDKVDVSADVLRDVAITYEKKNMTLALKVMKMAAKKRPNGPFILKKLREYQQVTAIEEPQANLFPTPAEAPKRVSTWKKKVMAMLH